MICTCILYKRLLELPLHASSGQPFGGEERYDPGGDPPEPSRPFGKVDSLFGRVENHEVEALDSRETPPSAPPATSVLCDFKKHKNHHLSPAR